jgi:hypothetical protein
MAGKFQSRSRLTVYLFVGFALAAANGFAPAATASPGMRDGAVVVAATTVAEVADETQSPDVPAAEAATDEAAEPAPESATADAAREERPSLDIDCLPEDLLEKLRAARA